MSVDIVTGKSLQKEVKTNQVTKWCVGLCI